MAKLYPPYIEGTLPAFWVDDEGNGEMVIPFAFNKAVSKEEIKSLSIKIKSVQNDVLLGSTTLEDNGGSWSTNGEVRFEVKEFYLQNGTSLGISIRRGMFYKIQLAFIDKGGTVGYYSTVGVIKCTSKPTVSIVGFDKNKVNNNSTEFIGSFVQSEGGDVTEKVYSSNFRIVDLQGNEIFDTDEVLHNVENNPNSYSSEDRVLFNRDLDFGQIYRIQYNVTTTNGLKISSPRYLLTQQKSLTMEFKGLLKAALNYEDGFVDVQTIGAVSADGGEEIIDGTFVLAREDSLNPGVWEELTRFAFNHEFPTRNIFRDFTIEQGKTYTYSLQQYNPYGIYSDRKKSNQVYADFDDMFLYDGERQLKLRLNPQVSSFKTQLAESRSETIGSKYPFFFRNARVGYKTFPISGLVSMRTDDNEFFVNYEDIIREDFIADRDATDTVESKKKWSKVYNHTNLLSENFASERLFKLEVLDWLNNGKVKLFRSPGEGNYLVRVMDTSLSPNAQIGRMLHTVSTTAYECADCIYEKLVEYGIIKNVSSDSIAATITNWREHSINNFSFNENINNGLASNNLLDDSEDSAYTTYLRFIDFIPGTRFKLVFDPSGNFNSSNSTIVEIGSTGDYYADDVEPVYGIYLLNNSVTNEQGKPLSLQFPSSGGSVSYQYETPGQNEFNLVKSTQADVGAYAQFVGPVDNLVKSVECAKEQVTQICMSNYIKRPVEYLYYRAGGGSFSTDLKNIFTDKDKEKGTRNLVDGLRLYWDLNFRPTDEFNDDESMEYSPFSLYIVKNIDIEGHLVNWGSADDYEAQHSANHYFEKYYIDRIINAQIPEEELINYCAVIEKLAELDALENPDEEAIEAKAQIKQWLNNNKLYMIDAWTGDIWPVSADNIYDPTITYNGENIDLREIQKYSLDNVDPLDSTITIGNGVYGEMYYQRVIIEYSFEDKVYHYEDKDGNIYNDEEKNIYEKENPPIKITYKKTPNPNGLPETWWDVQDWARYYAIVNILLEGKDPEDISEEDYWQYYPMNYLKFYKKTDDIEFLPTFGEVQAVFGTKWSGSWGRDTDHIQMVMQHSDGTWSSHGSSCTHSFFQFIPNFKVLDDNGDVKKYYDKEHNIEVPMETWRDVREDTKVYVYRPTFPGEFEYDYGITIEDGGNSEIVIDLSKYADWNKVYSKPAYEAAKALLEPEKNSNKGWNEENRDNFTIVNDYNKKYAQFNKDIDYYLKIYKEKK